jgi:hypothetical protein
MVTRDRETKHRTLLKSVLSIHELTGAKSRALCRRRRCIRANVQIRKRSREKRSACTHVCSIHFCTADWKTSRLKISSHAESWLSLFNFMQRFLCSLLFMNLRETFLALFYTDQ